MSELAENLKTIRKELKCTHAEIAEVLKIEYRPYVRYETGERVAPVSALIKIARLANVSLEQFITTRISGDYVKSPDWEKF